MRTVLIIDDQEAVRDALSLLLSLHEIRRAIGATRGDIPRYFKTENFLIVTFGVMLGVALPTCRRWWRHVRSRNWPEMAI